MLDASVFIFSDKLCLYKFMNKIIIANWKENPGDLEVASKLISISEKFEKKISDEFWFKYENNLKSPREYEIKIAHAVPSIFADRMYVEAKRTKIILQNISEFESGSHTGEVSVKQMMSSGIQASILGHSETRLSPNNPRGDEDFQVNLKIKNLIKNNCSVLLCVGEYERAEPGLMDLLGLKDSENLHFKFVKGQLDNCLKDIEVKDLDKIMIAYEPIWAIGKNAKRVATNEEIVEMVKFIKDFINEKFGAGTQVLYGGSVDENNAKEILNLEGVDGLLVGRASSDPDKWGKLLENISGSVKQNNQNKFMQNSNKNYNEVKDLNLKAGDRVLLRVDFNVPTKIENGEEIIVNSFRIDETIPTIKMLQDIGCKIVVLGHREKGDFGKIAEYLAGKVENLKFGNEVPNLQNGEVFLLDNLRLNEGEKKNDIEFAKQLASYGDFYINEAFSASHREHASIVGIPRVLKERAVKNVCALGPKFVNEIQKLSLVLNPQHPMLLIVGGAKFDTKLAMLEKFLPVADNIFVGGALSHNFWKQKNNFNLGKSLLDEEVKLTEKVLNSNKIILPVDVMVESREVKNPSEIMDEERIVDFGNGSLKQILNLAEQAQTIVWNGPLGYYEGGYDMGTKNLLLGLAKIQKENSEKVIILGGGDTVTEIDKTNEELEKEGKSKMQFTHVSTGGGAMIDLLSNGTLPGIQAVTNS